MLGGMRAVTGYASVMGVAIAFASLFASALGWMDGSSDRDFSTAELFNPELYVDGDARPAIAISIWVAVIAFVAAIAFTAWNSTTRDRPPISVLIASYLVSGVAVVAPLAVIIGVVGLNNLVGGSVGAGAPMFFVGGASIAFACILSLGAYRHNEAELS